VFLGPNMKKVVCLLAFALAMLYLSHVASPLLIQDQIKQYCYASSFFFSPMLLGPNHAQDSRKYTRGNMKLSFLQVYFSLKDGNLGCLNVGMSQKDYDPENPEKQQHDTQQSLSRWSQMAGQVLESLTGKNMTATMDFQNLEINLPKAVGPDGRDLGSAKWVLNGKIVWTTELHKTD
jgi:hypothetical protein